MAPAVRERAFVLVHSPLLGPMSWLPVAQELGRRGRGAVVPSLLGVADAPEPQWRYVPDAVRTATRDLRQPIVLAGHSGAGVLLPVIADALAVGVAGLVFVDSFLPPPAGELPLAPPEFSDQLRAMATEGVLPPWSHWFGPEAMTELAPDERLRAHLEAEMPRLPLSYFEATVPLPDGWPRRYSCAYLLLSATPYGQSATEARSYGWPTIEIHGAHHLATATNARAVTQALLDLETSLDNKAVRQLH
jgi:hypothetical protein